MRLGAPAWQLTFRVACYAVLVVWLLVVLAPLFLVIAALVKIADEIRKASRIRTHGVLNSSEPLSKEPAVKEKRAKSQDKEQHV